MNTLKIGIVHSDQKGQETIANAFEDILLDEICTKTLYEKQGEEGIDEALADWEDGNTDAILFIPAEGEERLNPASLRGLDMIVWEDLRMAFADEEEDFEEQVQTLRTALERDFYIDNPRIVPHLDAENYKTYDAVLTKDREQGAEGIPGTEPWKRSCIHHRTRTGMHGTVLGRFLPRQHIHCQGHTEEQGTIRQGKGKPSAKALHRQERGHKEAT